jgi:hypothetical protein
MAAIKRKPQVSKPTPSPRASITFQIDHHQSSEDPAKKNEISIAWLEGEVTEKYIAGK